MSKVSVPNVSPTGLQWYTKVDPLYLSGGHADLSLRRMADGKEHHWRVRRVIDKRGVYHFVDYLAEGGWHYIGLFNPDAKQESDVLVVTQRAKFVKTSVPVRAFQFFMLQVLYGNSISEGYQIGHPSVCSRCGRELKDEESLHAGVGPKCRHKVLEQIKTPK